MTKKKLSDQINDWLRWESHSKTLAGEDKKCYKWWHREQSERWEAAKHGLSGARDSAVAKPLQPCEFSEMLAALQNDLSSLPREWNVWDWNLTVHIVSLSAPNFISPTWIEIQFCSRDLMVMTGCLRLSYQVTLDFCNVPLILLCNLQLIFLHVTCNKGELCQDWGGIAASGRCSDDCLNTNIFQESCITANLTGDDIKPPVTRHRVCIIRLGLVLFRSPPQAIFQFYFPCLTSL